MSPQEASDDQELRDKLTKMIGSEQTGGTNKAQGNIDPALGQNGTAQQQIAQTPIPLPVLSHPVPQQTPSSPEESSDSPKKRGLNRELSTSKRAAQNRAAQRAFRQRKEEYIKKLEGQVEDFKNMQESYKQVQMENSQLRDYIIHLQNQIIASHGNDSIPPPPPVFNNPTPVYAVAEEDTQTTGRAARRNAANVGPTTTVASAPTATMGQKRQRENVANPVQPATSASANFLQSIAQAAQSGNNDGFVHTPGVSVGGASGDGFVHTPGVPIANAPKVAESAPVAKKARTTRAAAKAEGVA